MAKPKTKKRKKVLVTQCVRIHGGEVTEPYRLLEALVDRLRADLAECRLAILWRSEWRADADGWVQMVNVKKAGDVDKALEVKADFAVMLNKERWQYLPERMKQVYLHHALCHVRPLIDSDGEQKRDDKNRLLWRMAKRHDVEQFSDVIKEWGPESLTLDKDALAAVNDAKRPPLAAAEVAETRLAASPPAAEAATDEAVRPQAGILGQVADGWQSLPLADLNLPQAVHEFVEAAGHKTIGSLSSWMAEKGEWWDRDLKVGGQRKPPNFRAKVEDAFAEFWATRKG